LSNCEPIFTEVEAPADKQIPTRLKLFFWIPDFDLQMPPKPKASADSLKQKNLTTFFAKGSTSGPTQAKPTPFKTPNVKTAVAEKRGRDNDVSRTQTSSSPLLPKTPVSDSSDIRVNWPSSAVPPSSVLSSRRASSPPTSDIIDVDMFASDDEDDQPLVKKTVDIIHNLSSHRNTDAKMIGFPEPTQTKSRNRRF
jgi:hypothetical protein